jgi:hypothetical protein
VITGELTEEQALTAFLSKYGDEGGFANGDGKISLQEFEQVGLPNHPILA